MSQKCKVAIIGAGRMADFHLQVLSAFDDVELVALANRSNIERAKNLCEKYGIPRNYQDFLKMFEQEETDAVVVSTSIVDNFRTTRECLSRGIPTLLEKPPGVTVQEAGELLKIAEEKSVVHMVGLQRRFSSHIQEGIRIVKEKGPILSIVVEAAERFHEIKAKNKFSDEILSKWIYANGIHCIDMLSYVGGGISEITAMREQWNETLHPDSLHALVKFDSHAIGHYISNWSSPGGWSVKIYGNGCRVDIQPMEKGRVVYADGTQTDLPVDPIDMDFKPGLYAQNRMFIDACLGKRRIEHPAATLKEALVAMQITDIILDETKHWDQYKQIGQSHDLYHHSHKE